MDTLQDFQVNYKHVTIPAFVTKVEEEVGNRMCIKGVALSQGIWFWDV